jgi:hypothetical protein
MQFTEWMIDDERDNLVRKELEKLIQRTGDPNLKAALTKIAARAPSTATFVKNGAQNDTFKDLMTFFKAKEKETGLPVMDVFGSLLAGRPAEFLIARFGKHTASLVRAIVVGAIEQFAREKNIVELVHLVQKFKDDADLSRNPYRPQRPTSRQGAAKS